MKKITWLTAVAMFALIPVGCVERRYVITTDPPGALVLRNGQQIGSAPADDNFVYYGKYNFTIIKEGFETQQVEQDIKSPWYEYFPLDFFAENVWPWVVTDRREFHYKLEPKKVVNTTELLNGAQNLRNKGIGLGGGSAAPQQPINPIINTSNSQKSGESPSGSSRPGS